MVEITIQDMISKIYKLQKETKYGSFCNLKSLNMYIDNY